MDKKLIDRKKLTLAIHNARKGARWEIEKSPPGQGDFHQPGFMARHSALSAVKPHEGKWGPELDWASVLYSLVAHLRGKVHAPRKYVPSYKADGLQVIVERTLEDQEKLLGEIWRLFAKDPAQSLEAEAKRAAIAAGL